MDLIQYIESGIIHSYILGISSEEEAREVEEMSQKYPEIREAISRISSEIESHAVRHSSKPPPVVKTEVMAAIDFMDRMMKGEKASFPPPLTEHSKIEDYTPWLNREDMVVTEPFEGMFARIIAHTPGNLTAIVWMKEMNTEAHTKEIEKFLIVEGSCELTMEGKTYQLTAGDMMSIPVGTVHRAVSTSVMPCKVILQKVAA